MSNIAFLLCILVNTAIVAVVLGSPLELDRPKNNSFIWYPTPEGGLVKAFLEGGPRFDAKASENDIKFYLFTLKNSNTRQELIIGDNEKLDSSNYIRGAAVKFLSHGFTSNSENDPTAAFKAAYFNNGLNYNVIAVDWAPLASAPWYGTAAAATKTVGEKTGRLVEWLISRGVVTLDQVHFVGKTVFPREEGLRHSLGAHAGGFFGNYFGAGRVNRITALDPALPLFGSKPDSERIDPSDAAFVDVIHTAAGSILEGGLAFEEPRGHIDFYPNTVELGYSGTSGAELILATINNYHYTIYGTNQPGCGADIFGTCSHGRGMTYMAESIGSPHKFKACKCDSWEFFEIGQCACTETAFMGEHAFQSGRGKFYLYTNSASPFSQT